jgi:hypothetical protein
LVRCGVGGPPGTAHLKREQLLLGAE